MIRGTDGGPTTSTGPDLRTTAGKLADARARREATLSPGSARAVERHHAKGKRTARERLEALLDEDSFVEVGAHSRALWGDPSQGSPERPPTDGVVAGHGTVDGRPVVVYSQDFTVSGGSLGEVHASKIVKVMDHALRVGCPVIGINDSGGARIQEGVSSLAGYGDIFLRNVRGSGVVPQVSLIMGPCAGGAVYSPAITDVVVMVEATSHMFVTGPDVIRTVTGEDVAMEELGGAHTHNAVSGVAHHMAPSEDDAIAWVKDWLAHLPSNNLSEAPVLAPLDDTDPLLVTDADLELDALVPDSANVPYDVHEVIAHVLDDGELLEVQDLFAPNVVVGFGRVEGHSVGVVANQPARLAGTLDIDASEKGARFVRLCDAFGIPVITLVDTPGFLPGTEQEWNGIIRRGAKLLYAYAEATVPKITVITRKAFGGAYIVMGSKHLGADVNLAWPTAQIAVMGAQGAVEIVHRRTLGAAAEQGHDVAAVRAGLVQEYEERLANPYVAAERGYVDDVIEPSATRAHVVRALRALRTKREQLPAKKHGNIPL
ncbi:acyl-CoA carboxylase subunit beta [Quadrisphaera setariae]|uniref:acyl-CoA carboxylase subunit beta n=1 Tax=Quadrisphaera setariae TaxID=2593304 RepID=UPI0034E2DE84